MIKRFLSVFLCMILLCGCAFHNQSVSDGVTFTDDTGAEVTVPQKPETVAVLLSSLADLWITAGGEVDITVGETVERGFVNGDVILVDAGAGKTVDLETLIAAQPDFVLYASDIAGQLECADTLRAAEIPAAGFAVETLADYLDLLKLCTEILDTPENYEIYGVQLKNKVDVLTLSATPIPRTLNMAMSGMRDLSIIATPPARRLAVKTFVREYDSLVVREAILREILRGGQVYYLYNDVENIQKAAERLAELVPEARIAIGHGQMRERELERVMNDFHHQRFNVLVCTTIIETGIDIPTANTIIIERADHFGLAQLHQLRGRVGRSHHQAYAWLLTPHPKSTM